MLFNAQRTFVVVLTGKMISPIVYREEGLQLSGMANVHPPPFHSADLT